MADVSYYTPEGYQTLKEELNHMKTVLRPSISQQIAEARDKGDLSENAEYDAAKEAQGMLEAKISKTEAIFASARIIDETQIDTSQGVYPEPGDHQTHGQREGDGLHPCGRE